MFTLIVRRTSVFPAGRREIFARLQMLKTLQLVARPYATFTPVDPKAPATWRPGSTSSYYFRLLGLIPFGTHKIHVIRFSETGGILTHECNEHVPVWDHKITLRALSGGNCEYTDTVRIGAGWKTPLIYLWACCFYAHRQRKWIRLLRKAGKS